MDRLVVDEKVSMTGNLLKFDPDKLSAALADDGRPKSRFARDAMINRKTFDKALGGQSVRPPMASRIAKALKMDLTKLLSDSDEIESDYQSATIDLTEVELTVGGSVDYADYGGDIGINTETINVFPSEPDEIVSALARGRVKIESAFSISETKTHPPYWHIEPDVVRSPDLTEALKTLDSALKEQKDNPQGARALGSLISSLETEVTVASALQQLVKINVHVLAGEVAVETNNGNPEPDSVQFLCYRVPILIIARTTVGTAEIRYRSVGKKHSDPPPPENDFDDDIPF